MLNSVQNKQAALLAIAVSIVVFTVQLLAYFVSNSVALLSQALESIVNIAAAGLMFISVHISGKPADESHNYGHQRAEVISSMIEGFFIVAASGMIVYEAVGRLFQNGELLNLDVGIVIALAGTATYGALGLFLSRKVSPNRILQHLKAILNIFFLTLSLPGGICAGLFIITLTGWTIIDSVLAFVVAGSDCENRNWL